MKLVICENDPLALEAHRVQFARYPEVQVLDCLLIDAPAEAIVSPGNSFGFMDRGLALKIGERFGFAFEDAVREAIRTRYAGEILVGQAEIFPTGSRPAYLVHAPIYRTPQIIHGTLNAYLAARGVFGAIHRWHQAGSAAIETIAFPSLGEATGKLHPLIAARQLRYAYEEAAGLRKLPHQNLSRLIRRERKLRAMPGAKEEEEAGA